MSTADAPALAQPIEGFDYVDLNEVDPNIKALPTDFYTLKVLKAEKKATTYKKTTEFHAAGDPCEYIKFTLAVTNSDNYSGRRVYPKPFFSGARELRTLRKLMDVTGVTQTPGTPITDWLAKLSEIQPEFKTQVVKVPGRNTDASGQPIDDNDVNWRELLPAE